MRPRPECGRKHGTVVNLPNSNFDPVKGHRLYNRYLDELEHARIGFDAIAVNEHHQTAYGLMPSPSLPLRRSRAAQGARRSHPGQPLRCASIR